MNLVLVTDMGDSLVLSGMVLAGTGYLLLYSCRRGAAALSLSLLDSAVLIGLLKLFIRGCNEGLQRYEIVSPSGHTALSTAVFGAYALLVASQLQGVRRFIPAILYMALVSAIAVTRVVLGFHTVPEVMIGLITGGIALVPVLIFLRRNIIEPFNIYGFILSAVVVAVVLNGFRLPAENVIAMLAQFIKSHMAFCTK